jgi:hypothetical protein
VHAPIAVDDLGDAEVDCDRHERKRFIRSGPASPSGTSASCGRRRAWRDRSRFFVDVRLSARAESER